MNSEPTDLNKKDITERTFDERKILSSSMRQKYDDRIPIVLNRLKSTDPCATQSKFLAPNNTNLTRFSLEVRKHIDVHPGTALFFLTADKTILTPSRLMNEIDQKHRDRDGFLYIYYTTENTFGWE